MVMRQYESLGLHGRCIMRAWKKGWIPALIAGGFSYEQAVKIALEDGHLVDQLEVKNLVVSSGLYLVADLLIGVEVTGLTIFAIGTGVTTPVVGDTTLTTETHRKILTQRARLTNVVTLDCFLLVSESTYFIKECGVFGGVTATVAPGSGRLFTHYLLSYDNSGGSNDLSFEYILTIP